MKYALIDMGSNSIRLSVYKINEDGFKILFKEKQMAGLASYVENGDMTNDGILLACKVLKDFYDILDLLQIENRKVFATASLRNINNTKEAVDKIKQQTNIDVEILSGEKEAKCGYLGAMVDYQNDSGIFVDIGGASSEITIFENHQIINASSYGIGSLKLYSEEVKKILPGKKSQQRIENRIKKAIKESPIKYEKMVAVGGSARATLKICKKVFDLDNSTRIMTIEQLDKLYDMFIDDLNKAAAIILKYEPERIHTLLPGLMILRNIAHAYGTKTIFVSHYGIREGYLLDNILKG